MTPCPSCHDAGVFKVAYHDGSPTEYALCLCVAGMGMRRATNNGKAVTPYWRVWAHEERIDPALVFTAEEILSDDELAARGLSLVATVTGDRESALLAAGKKAKR